MVGRDESFTVFFRCNKGKGPVIANDSEDDIADLVHNSADGCHLGFRFTLLRVVILQHRIFGMTGAGGTNGLHGDDIDHPSGVARTAFREPDVCTNKMTGLFHRRVQAKVGIELLGTAKGMEIANFADQRDSSEKSNSRNRLEQTNLFRKGFVLVCFEDLPDLGQQFAGLLFQRTDHTDKVTDEVETAVHTVTKAGGILRRRHQLVAGLLRCCAAPSGCGRDHGD